MFRPKQMAGFRRDGQALIHEPGQEAAPKNPFWGQPRLTAPFILLKKQRKTSLYMSIRQETYAFREKI